MASHSAHGCIIWVVYQVGSHLSVILCLQTPSHLLICAQDTTASMKVCCKCQHDLVVLVIASVLMNLDCKCQHGLVFLPGTVTQRAASLHDDSFEGETCVDSPCVK